MQEFAALIEDVLLEEELSEPQEATASDRKGMECKADRGSGPSTKDCSGTGHCSDPDKQGRPQSNEQAGTEGSRGNLDSVLPEEETRSNETPADRILRHLRTVNESTVREHTTAFPGFALG